MFPTFVIGLREGLEAALIVGIIAAFLRARGDARSLRLMWVGVLAAIALAAAVGFGLDALDRSLPQARQETLEALIALVAAGTVSAMIVWMKRHARDLRSSLETHAELALARGTALSLVAMAFLAVLREGFETSVFLLAVFQHSTNPAAAGVGAIAGLAVAVGLGYGIARGGVRLDLARFFRVTGVVLVLVAAGLVASAVHSAHEAGWLNVLQQPAFSLAWLVAPGSLRAALLTGIFGLQPEPSVLEVSVWFLYAVPLSLYVLWPTRSKRPPVPSDAGVAGADRAGIGSAR